VFVDNDLLVTSGWLRRLVEAADREKAWIVGPTYLEGRLENRIVHMAGGEAHMIDTPGGRRFHESHRFMAERLDDVADQIRPGPTELVEFHCMLVRRDVFDRLGPLDEELMTFGEHIDLCMQVRIAGGLVYFEPASTVVYVTPPPFDPTDRPYYLLRWSESWNRRTLNRFSSKWCLAADDPYLPHAWRWVEHHREWVLRELAWPLGRMVGRLKYGALKTVGRGMVRALESAASRGAASRRRAAEQRGEVGFRHP